MPYQPASLQPVRPLTQSSLQPLRQIPQGNTLRTQLIPQQRIKAVKPDGTVIWLCTAPTGGKAQQGQGASVAQRLVQVPGIRTAIRPHNNQTYVIPNSNTTISFNRPFLTAQQTTESAFQNTPSTCYSTDTPVRTSCATATPIIRSPGQRTETGAQIINQRSVPSSGQVASYPGPPLSVNHPPTPRRSATLNPRATVTTPANPVVIKGLGPAANIRYSAPAVFQPRAPDPSTPRRPIPAIQLNTSGGSGSRAPVWNSPAPTIKVSKREELLPGIMPIRDDLHL